MLGASEYCGAGPLAAGADCWQHLLPRDYCFQLPGGGGAVTRDSLNAEIEAEMRGVGDISAAGALSDYAQLLVTAQLNNGARTDVTRMVKLSAQGDVASASLRGQITPKKDGSGSITVELTGLKAAAKVSVQGIGTKRKIDYVRDVMPVLSKLGCNQGICHGSKDGKNGFKLSLRGYDPLYDVRAFTDELASRRVNIKRQEGRQGCPAKGRGRREGVLWRLRCARRRLRRAEGIARLADRGRRR